MEPKHPPRRERRCMVIHNQIFNIVNQTDYAFMSSMQTCAQTGAQAPRGVAADLRIQVKLAGIKPRRRLRQNGTWRDQISKMVPG